MKDTGKGFFEKTTQIKNNSTRTEMFNEVMKRNDISLNIKTIDDLKLNSPSEVSTIRISSAYYQRFLTVKDELKARGISISSQEFFDYIISQFFLNS
ncbi:hypothetical protein [Chryseobacterium sp. 18068]|uniref:hypothetical protein n=1 Tax=Chryseobacterium sp. 18068 TaxID=2681414 RepID=UPI00135715B8|nr:hypothetical protein [Chryseobacterium sp. 18068]